MRYSCKSFEMTRCFLMFFLQDITSLNDNSQYHSKSTVVRKTMQKPATKLCQMTYLEAHNKLEELKQLGLRQTEFDLQGLGMRGLVLQISVENDIQKSPSLVAILVVGQRLDEFAVFCARVKQLADEAAQRYGVNILPAQA